MPRVAVTMAVTIAVAVASAVPLRGVTDVRPEISRVLAVEESTVGVYQTRGHAVQARNGERRSAGPADRAEDHAGAASACRHGSRRLGRVPPEHQPLLASAEEYLRLRDESWRLRAAALHKSSMPALRKAETAERASLQAFERLKPAEPAADTNSKPRSSASRQTTSRPGLVGNRGGRGYTVGEHFYVSAITLASLTFACAFGGALLGAYIRSFLPPTHLTKESLDVMRLGMGLVATMTALLLGLVTASARSTFDSQDAAMRTSAANILTLDRLLARYGPETKPTRDLIRTGGRVPDPDDLAR